MHFSHYLRFRGYLIKAYTLKTCEDTIGLELHQIKNKIFQNRNEKNVFD